MADLTAVREALSLVELMVVPKADYSALLLVDLMAELTETLSAVY